MIAEPQLLINAPEKKKDIAQIWSERADWSSRDAMLAFWSAHPPSLRDAFLENLAKSNIAALREKIRKAWAQRAALREARRWLIHMHLDAVSKLTVNSMYRLKRRRLREELIEGLVSIRAKRTVMRSDIRRSIRYLRAIEPKQTDHVTESGNMVSTMIGKSVHIVIQKPKTYAALSLWNPWAMMVAWGLKEFETRSWNTSYRGVLLIHAAKRWTQAEKDICRQHPFNRAIANHLGGALSDMPLGCIVAVAELVQIVPTNSLTTISREERAVGNFAPGRFAWKLANVRALATPIPVKGGQGLFEWRGVIDG